MTKRYNDSRGGEFSRHIGERVRHFRSEQNISLSELSRQAGIAKGTLSKLEAGEGNPTIITLGALARILKVTPGDFIDRPGSHPDQPAKRHDLSGPGMRMLFIHRIIASTIWDVYEVFLPALKKPLLSATHGGIEHLTMIEGEAEVGPVAEPVLLRPGQHTSFKGGEAHSYFPIKGPCRMVLMMEYSEAERSLAPHPERGIASTQNALEYHPQR